MTVEEFNQKFSVGEQVVYKDDFDELQTRKLSTPAQTLANGHPVVWLEGRPGCFCMDRIHKMPV